MAVADTARLIASLELKDKFSPGMKKVLGTVDTAEARFGAIGAKAQQGVASFTKNIALIGVAAAGGIAVAVKSGLRDLAELESAIASVDGAIEQMGLTGQLTGKQVADWANQIEADIGAAFDDKAITAAATTLLRFGKVTPKNLEPALVVLTDLATKTGDIDSAASLLAKALADPAKAAGKLARVGIVLTKEQQKQLKAMVAVNDVAGAQALLLDALSASTKGAALASQGPYQRSLSLLADAGEDARKALAEGFLPVIEKVAARLSKAVGDPKFIAGIREFGKTLASGLDDLIDIAAKLPWTQIGDSLRIAGSGAKILLDAFTKLPPWVQTAVITGWGLNKLTGGALGGIVGELAKGLIKGVLGINAGVVNINAATVNGPGGVGKAAAGAAGSAVSAVGGVLTAGAIILALQAAAKEAISSTVLNITGSQQTATKSEAITPVAFGAFGPPILDTLEQIQRVLAGDNRSLLERIADGEEGTGKDVRNVGSLLAGKAEKTAAQMVSASNRTKDDTVAAINVHKTQALTAAQKYAAQQVAAVSAASAKDVSATAAVKSATDAAALASRNAGVATAAAIRDKDLSVEVHGSPISVNVRTSVGSQIKSQATFKKAGNVFAL